MITSPGRTWDRNIRALLLENIAMAIKRGDVQLAKELGVVSEKLKQRIKEYDYSEIDAQYAEVARMDREWEKLASGKIHE